MEEESKIKENARQDIVILINDWRKKKRRIKLYRGCLWVAFTCSILCLIGIGYFNMYNQIPSVLRIRAGIEQSFDFGVPLQGEVIAVSEQDGSNIPKGAVHIDLSKKVTMKMNESAYYQMNVTLFGLINFKNVGIQVIDDTELIPVGIPIGIYVKTDGLLVIGIGEFNGMDGTIYSPSKYILKSGDYIQKLNGVEVSEKEDFIKRIEAGDGSEVILTVNRADQIIEIKVKPMKDTAGSYKIGVWIRDNAQGVGTMTYIDADGNFGALGHGINDVDTSTLMEMEDGTLYQTEIINIKKGVDGTPGEMTGMIIYSPDRILGDIYANNTQGIFGACNEKALQMITEEAIPIALKQEIEIGPAQILCTVDGSPTYYDIKINEIHLDHDNVNRGIEIEVTDPELLELTGGIVQGMSGAPIIQKGKLIGAVTHVLVQNSKKGYGIFIENMLEH